MRQGVLERYREFLPVTDKTPVITIGEGDTPLIRSRVIEKGLGCELYFKLEGCNPPDRSRTAAWCSPWPRR